MTVEVGETDSEKAVPSWTVPELGGERREGEGGREGGGERDSEKAVPSWAVPELGGRREGGSEGGREGRHTQRRLYPHGQFLN